MVGVFTCFHSYFEMDPHVSVNVKCFIGNVSNVLFDAKGALWDGRNSTEYQVSLTCVWLESMPEGPEC